MIVTGTQDLVDQIAVVGEENQPLRVFIQTANREDTAAVVHEINDVVPLTVFRGADNPNRFVQRDKHQVFGITRFDELTIHFNHVARHHLVTNRGALAVEEHITLFNVTVRLAT